LLAVIFAVLFFAGVRKLSAIIKQNEKEQILLWSQALENKSSVLSLTKSLFERIKVDEKVKVELWADAMQLLLQNKSQGDVDLLVKIVSSNRNIPIVLVNGQNKIASTVNIDFELPRDSSFNDSIARLFSSHPPIRIDSESLPKSELYYQDSRIYKDLQIVLNEYVAVLVADIVENSVSLPVIVADSIGSTILLTGNLDSAIVVDTVLLKKKLQVMSEQNAPIPLALDGNHSAFVFYENSFLLTVLRYTPLAVMALLVLFVSVAFLAFNASRKYDQNQLWVGMSKETAHQLGTPISSLMAWVELLKLDPSQQDVATEINKDVDRLSMVAERFSNIGSEPKLVAQDILKVLSHALSYLKRRTPESVVFIFSNNLPEATNLSINVPLFEWVVENLVRNAVDAMVGTGTISVTLGLSGDFVVIDVSDAGKGIAKRKQKDVFRAGYTTKKRGWGLGLALAKRIIEEYHHGKIFVKKSEVGIGTTFRILLHK